MTEVTGVDHVQLDAPPGCEAEARAYFGALLGLEELEKPPRLATGGGVWFGLGSQALHVGVEPDFAPARKAHPALRVASVEALDALAASLGDAGHAVVWADPEEIPGTQRFFVDDPWGNRLELLA